MGALELHHLNAPAAARPHYLEALPALEERAKAAPRNVEAQRDLMEGYNGVGLTGVWSGDVAAGRDLVLKAIRLGEQLPANDQRARDLAGLYANFALVSRCLGDAAAVRDFYQKEVRLREELAAGESENAEGKKVLADARHRLAWALATGPDPSLRDPPRAVELATKAVQAAPDSGDFWTTLGAAHYRAGDRPAALTALGKATRLPSTGRPQQWFFLALACWHEGRRDEAREWRRKAVGWMETNEPFLRQAQSKFVAEELGRFRAEVQTLMDP